MTFVICNKLSNLASESQNLGLTVKIRGSHAVNIAIGLTPFYKQFYHAVAAYIPEKGKYSIISSNDYVDHYIGELID